MKIKNYIQKNVYIVGGSSGIGLATAKLLTQKGANVLIFARRKEVLEEALEQLEQERVNPEQKLEYRALSIADPEAVNGVFEASAREFGEPQVLINCAGRALPGYFEDITYAQFHETMQVNLYGIWNTVKAAAPYIKKHKGYIVNTGSMVGLMGVFGYTDYAASKYAVSGFTETLRAEMKPHGVGVTLLCPPDTDTPGFKVENQAKPRETMAISEKAGCLAPEVVAVSLLKAMEKGRGLVVPGLEGRFTHMMKRLMPGAVEWVMDRAVKKVRLLEV